MFGAETVELINQDRLVSNDAKVVNSLSEHFTRERIVKDISAYGHSSFAINAEREILDKWFVENFDISLFTYSYPTYSGNLFKIFLKDL